MEALNLKLFFWLNQGSGQQPFVDTVAIFFGEGGPYLLMFGLVIFWFMAGDRHRHALLEATEASLLGLLINQLLGMLLFYPRPYMVGLVQPLIVHGPENSFPSDHATLMLTVALYLLCCEKWKKQGAILLLLALTTAWGRIYAGIHFPLDMLGSLGVACFSFCLVLWQHSLLKPFNRRLIQYYQQINNRLLKHHGNSAR
ncbi:MAG: undecaprenyl-diphosphatase [Desulfuromusa sp.]|jgi:undecaprenyl-diphosphatase|nr:undecaprenyl-diphosphatase [Desulfuromusa sp.]